MTSAPIGFGFSKWFLSSFKTKQGTHPFHPWRGLPHGTPEVVEESSRFRNGRSPTSTMEGLQAYPS